MMHCPHSTRRRARVRSFCIFRSTSQLQIQLSGILNGRQAHLLHRTEMIIPKLDAMWTVDLWEYTTVEHHIGLKVTTTEDDYL